MRHFSRLVLHCAAALFVFHAYSTNMCLAALLICLLGVSYIDALEKRLQRKTAIIQSTVENVLADDNLTYTQMKFLLRSSLKEAGGD